jgi:hypothetical protein
MIRLRRQIKYKPDFLLKRRDFMVKQNYLLVVREGILIAVMTYRCVSVRTTMSEQVVPSAAAQCTVVKFLTNEKVKLADILMRLRAQFGVETLSRTQLCDWSKVI